MTTTARTRQPRNTLKAMETRHRILRAALELFQERGFAETTMRDIARRASVATGAAYYYFDSKESLVLAFYLETQRQLREGVGAPLAKISDLRERLRAVLEVRFEQFAPYRRVFTALFRSAGDPESPISPFSEETREIREQAIAVFAEVLEGSSTRVPPDLKPHLPRLFWLYQMGLILFWIHDRSPGQVRTKRLLEKSLDLVVRAIKISSLRVMAPIRRGALELLRSLEEGAEAGDGDVGTVAEGA